MNVQAHTCALCFIHVYMCLCAHTSSHAFVSVPQDADSDDESFTSSQVSEMGSPFTLSSPSTPLPTSSSILGPSTSSADKSSAHALPSLTADVSTPQSSGRGGDLNEVRTVWVVVLLVMYQL